MSTLNNFWLKQTADRVEEYIKRVKKQNTPIICAAGMTPSCPIHAGILREGLITYFITKELKSRGFNAKFIFYWDDFDHFVKIPYYTSHKEVGEHIGKPLCDTPDVFSNKFDSFGAHNIYEFEACLARLGIKPVYNYQCIFRFILPPIPVLSLPLNFYKHSLKTL
ncbi:MAG: hypothetical protein JXB88_15605, partial [Spirochaetales bacterium]|nr:hypothetical protein [Spirochaetales bacterium]